MTLRLFGDLKPAGALNEWAAPSQGGPPVGFPAIRPIRDGTPSTSFPTTTLGLILAIPAGTDWSNWSQLTAGEEADHVLATLNAHFWHRENRPVFIQLGVGAAPSDNIIGEWFDHVSGPPPAQTVSYSRQYDIDGLTLPASTALAIRARSAFQSATAEYNQVGVAVAAMPTPLTFAPDWNEEAYRGGITAIKRVPDIPTTLTLTTGDAEQYGDWTELQPSASGHQLAHSIEMRTSGANPPPFPHLVVQLGIGPTADNVVSQETVPFPNADLTSRAAGIYRLPRPVEVFTADRLWLRAKATTASQPAKVAALLHYLNF